LRKLKNFSDAEFEVIDAKISEGTEKDAVVWVCKTDTDSTFDVRPIGDIDSRKEMYINRKKYIGQNLTVKFQDLGENGIPRFPVGVGFRNFE
jgi:DNA ligase OB-like domain